MICTLWLASCVSGQINSKQVPKVYPPNPYNADGSLVWKYDAENDTIIIPYWYWEKIFDYIADTQANQEILK
jgi:hypothetical protein